MSDIVNKNENLELELDYYLQELDILYLKTVILQHHYLFMILYQTGL